MDSGNGQICVRVDRGLRAALEQTARAQHRTLSGQLRLFLEQGLENSGQRDLAQEGTAMR